MEYIKTFRELFRNPGDVIDNFVFERETEFQHPFSFGLIGAIIVVAFYSLVLGYRTPILADLVSRDIDQYQQLAYWIRYANVKVSTFLLPLSMFLLLSLSLSIPGLFFLRENIDSFYCNLILNLYAVGASMLGLLFLVPIWFIMPSTLFSPIITAYMPLVLVGIVVIRIYERYLFMEGIRSWIQILSNYVLGCVIFLLLENFTASIIGYFIFAVNRFLDIWMTV